MQTAGVAISFLLYDTAYDPMAMLAIEIEKLRQKIPDADFFEITVRKWSDDSEGT